MFWNTLKTVGGLVAGATAAKVTTVILKAFTSNKIELSIVSNDSTVINGSFGLKRNRIEKTVLAVGTFVIAGTVGACASKYMVNEIGDIENFIKVLREDTDSVVEEINNVK